MTVTQTGPAAGGSSLPSALAAPATPAAPTLEGLEHTVARWCADLPDVDPLRVARRTLAGLPAGAGRPDAAELAVQTAAELIGEEPQYSKLAARLLSAVIADEVAGQGVDSFSGSIALGHPIGCTGTRITVTLLHEMLKRKAKRGVATLCVSGGMGMALALESA